MLYAGTRNADGVYFLERVFTYVTGWNLAADNHQWDRVHICSCNACHRIGYPGAGSHQCHPYFVGRTRVSIGCMNRRLFVAHQYMFDLILIEQGIIDKQHRPAGIAENVFDSFFLQTSDGNLCACQFHVYDLS